MNHAYCQCGREHRFNGDRCLCPCGAVCEPQTRREFFENKQHHLARVALISESSGISVSKEPK